MQVPFPNAMADFGIGLGRQRNDGGNAGALTPLAN